MAKCNGRGRDIIGLTVKAVDHHNNSKDNHRFCNVKPKCSLYELENEVRFCHDLLRPDFSPARSALGPAVRSAWARMPDKADQSFVLGTLAVRARLNTPEQAGLSCSLLLTRQAMMRL
jgi:hypothetical protein